jgi:hypothetical protein
VSGWGSGPRSAGCVSWRGSRSRRSRGGRAGISLALLVSAALLFLLEPMVGNDVFPLLGSAPEVGPTTVLFFQAALLAGWAFAHATSRWPPRRQALPQARAARRRRRRAADRTQSGAALNRRPDVEPLGHTRTCAGPLTAHCHGRDLRLAAFETPRRDRRARSSMVRGSVSPAGRVAGALDSVSLRQVSLRLRTSLSSHLPSIAALLGHRVQYQRSMESAGSLGCEAALERIAVGRRRSDERCRTLLKLGREGGARDDRAQGTVAGPARHCVGLLLLVDSRSGVRRARREQLQRGSTWRSRPGPGVEPRPTEPKVRGSNPLGRVT